MLACRHMRARAHTHILIKASDEIKASSNGMCKCIFCDTLCFCKPVEMFKDFNTSFLLADGEIINQIKMTNLALADIKELLKQQVSIIFGGCHQEKMNLLLKAQSEVSCLSTDGVLQIKEIEFLKNTVMECEACGECDGRGRQTLTPPGES